jgi:hypothetical protein
MQQVPCRTAFGRQRMRQQWYCRSVIVALVALAAVAWAPRPAAAQHIENGKAIFAALDKVTARISRLEVDLGQTVRFGALKVTPRVCHTRPPTEPPKTTTFVEIEETLLDGKAQPIFAGWMFAESPGMNAVEHPVYDVWLTDCSDPRRPTARAPGASRDAAGEAPAGSEPPRRPRPRR